MSDTVGGYSKWLWRINRHSKTNTKLRERAMDYGMSDGQWRHWDEENIRGGYRVSGRLGEEGEKEKAG